MIFLGLEAVHADRGAVESYFEFHAITKRKEYVFLPPHVPMPTRRSTAGSPRRNAFAGKQCSCLPRERREVP
jgi:hypothetical protein